VFLASSIALTSDAASAVSGVSALSSVTGTLEDSDYSAYAGAQLTVDYMLADAYCYFSRVTACR
jgi:hypothetical protein